MSSFLDYIPLFQLDMNDIVRKIMQIEEVQKAIIEYNQSQLQQGIDSEGKRIRTIAAEEQGGSQVYSLYTIREKAEKGQDFGNVTLEDTGATYKSMRVKVNDSNVEVLANMNIHGESILDNFEIGKYEFFGLTDENKKGFAIWIFSEHLERELKLHFKLS